MFIRHITKKTPLVQYSHEIRLVNGRGSPEEDNYSGRVEVRRNGGPWGTVCDDDFDNEDALVICRGFGFDNGEPRTRAYFGQGVGPILMDDLNCTGHERSIFECPHDEWGRSDCRHDEDAGVICTVSPF